MGSGSAKVITSAIDALGNRTRPPVTEIMTPRMSCWVWLAAWFIDRSVVVSPPLPRSLPVPLHAVVCKLARRAHEFNHSPCTRAVDHRADHARLRGLQIGRAHV